MDDVKIRPVHPLYNLKEILFFNYSIQKYVDTLIIGSNGSVKAHSTILTEKSDVFKNLLAFQQNEQEKVINLPQFSLEVIKVILEYLYRGDSRYFIEIEKEIKKAIRFFFETSVSLDPDECVEVKEIVPIVILSESDGTNTDLDELPQSPVRHNNIRYGTNKSKQCVTELPIVNTISSKVDSSHKSKKELLQSNIISQSGTSRSRVEGPLPRSLQEVAEKTNQQSVSVEDSTKKSTTDESFINKKRVFNPFASQKRTAHKDTQALSSQEATSKDPSVTLPVLESKKTSNSPVKRHRTIYESTDDEDDPLNPLNHPSNDKSKLRKTPTKKTMQRNKTAKNNKTGSKKNTKSNKIGSKKTAQSDNSENKSGFNESGKNLHTKPLKLVSQMCVMCMKEHKNIGRHIYKKHRVIGYRTISCKKCSHYFAFKFLCNEHQKNCTGKCKFCTT